MVDILIYKLVTCPKKEALVVREGAGGTVFALDLKKVEGSKHKKRANIIFDVKDQVVVLPIPVVIHVLVNGDPDYSALRAYGLKTEFDLTRYESATYVFYLDDLNFRLYIHKNLEDYPKLDERDIIEAEVMDGLLTGNAHVLDRERVEKGYRHYIEEGTGREYFEDWNKFASKITTQQPAD